MATQPTDTGSVAAFPGMAAPMPAVARILARYDRPKLAAFIAIAIDLLDTLEGDADNEDGDPTEANGDEADCAMVEWHGLRWRAKRSGKAMPIDTPGRGMPDEGDEEDDAPGQYDEDSYTGTRPRGRGPGCVISDSDCGDTYPQAMEIFMRVALKAQANSRATLEALAKLHQPREQTVRHVHVNEGGQAVIADQFHHHAGGAENGHSIEQPHAQGTCSPALPSPDPFGNGVPIASGAGRAAVPDARRQG